MKIGLIGAMEEEIRLLKQALRQESGASRGRLGLTNPGLGRSILL